MILSELTNWQENRTAVLEHSNENPGQRAIVSNENPGQRAIVSNIRDCLSFKKRVP